MGQALDPRRLHGTTSRQLVERGHRKTSRDLESWVLCPGVDAGQRWPGMQSQPPLTGWAGGSLVWPRCPWSLVETPWPGARPVVHARYQLFRDAGGGRVPDSRHSLTRLHPREDQYLGDERPLPSRLFLGSCFNITGCQSNHIKELGVTCHPHT